MIWISLTRELIKHPNEKDDNLDKPKRDNRTSLPDNDYILCVLHKFYSLLFVSLYSLYLTQRKSAFSGQISNTHFFKEDRQNNQYTFFKEENS